jgi:hypothetical protein
MSQSLMEIIGYQVQATAEWRRCKAEQFPKDAARNLRAAEELDRLAAQIEQLEGSDVHNQIAELQDGFIRACDDNDGLSIWQDENETVSAELRAVGFHGSYSTALPFLEWYRDLLQEKLYDQLDKAVPIPNLDEQVKNDPAVKAAKKAYDEAYAKAYAGALKEVVTSRLWAVGGA